MIFSKNNNRGVITVFVALMLTGLLSLGTLTMEAGRIQAAKTQISDANASAASSMIASFDDTLYSRYGLLVIDNETMTEDRYRDYVTFNSDLSVSFGGNNITKMYTLSDFEVEGLYNLTYPSVLKRQILARAKYNVNPQDYSLNYYTMDSYFADLQNKATYISESISTAAKGNASTGSVGELPATVVSALKSMQNTFKPIKKYNEGYSVTLDAESISLLPSTTGTVQHSVPDEDLNLINASLSDAQSKLGSNGDILASSSTAFSQTDVSVSPTISNAFINVSIDTLNSQAVNIAAQCNNLVQGVNAAINTIGDKKEGEMLLNSYISQFFSNRNKLVDGYTGPAQNTATVENTAFTAACTEYVFGGEKSEATNQQLAYDYIIASRMISNLYSVITNSSFYNANDATNVAAHILWAYYESYTDAQLLAKYNASLPNNKYNSILPINNSGAVSSAFAGANFDAAMSLLGIVSGGVVTVDGLDKGNYSDALAQALWFVPNSKKLLRVADLIQLEMRYREQYIENKTPEFLMRNQNTFCRAKCIAKMNSLLPVLSTGENGGINAYRFESVKYVGY